MIEVDILLGLGTLKTCVGTGKVQDKEFHFIKLRREGVCIRLAVGDRKGIEELQKLLDEIKKVYFKNKEEGAVDQPLPHLEVM